MKIIVTSMEVLLSHIKIHFATYFSLLLFFVTIITRTPLIEQYESHWDGPQFSMAVVKIDLRQDIPTTPGYPIYIFLGKIIHFFIPDPHVSILVVGIITTGLGAMLYFFVGKRLFSEPVGIIASLLYLSGATFYFLSLTAHGYVMVPVATLLFAYLCYQHLFAKQSNGILVGLAFALAVGLRPQELPFLIPLLLFVGVSSIGKESIKILISAFIGNLLWIIPISATVGGVMNYYRLNATFGATSVAGSNIFSNFHEHILILLKGFFLSFSASSIFLLYYGYLFFKQKSSLRTTFLSQKILFWMLWIGPALLYNIFIRSDQAGHQMTYLSAFVLLIAYAVYEVTKRKRILLIITVVLLVLVNLYTFFRDRDPTYSKPYVTTSFHYSEIRKNDLKLGSKVEFIKNHFDPRSTLLITSELLWRPYMYHLKNYHLIALSGLDISDPNFKDHEYTGYEWKEEKLINKTHTAAIPKDITTLIFTDDQSPKWIKHQTIKTYTLPGKSVISVISIGEGTKLHYDYHQITLSK